MTQLYSGFSALARSFELEDLVSHCARVNVCRNRCTHSSSRAPPCRAGDSHSSTIGCGACWRLIFKHATPLPRSTLTPREFFRGPTLILGPKGCFLFANAVEYNAATSGGRPAELEEYVMWGFSARRKTYGSSVPLEMAEGTRLRAYVVALMSE
jgi:hypothetical protein